MFEVLMPARPRKPRHLGPTAWTEVNSIAGISGSVTFKKTAMFAHLHGHEIQCDTGHLWVTIENDHEDHVLFPGQRLLVPTPGKVVIGGRGRYSLWP